MDRLSLFLWVIALRRRLFFSIVFFATLAAIIFVFIIPKEYTAVGSILPSSGGGFSTPAFLKTIFPDFAAAGELESTIYPDILGSWTLLEKVFSKKYTYKKRSKMVEKNLFETFGWSNMDEVIRYYPEKIKISTSLETGLLKIAVTTHYPELSAAVANEYGKGRVVIFGPHPEYPSWQGGYVEEAKDIPHNRLGELFKWRSNRWVNNDWIILRAAA